jgi:polysaccharide biosynthesis/export protein
MDKMTSRRYVCVLLAAFFFSFSLAAFGQETPTSPPSIPEVPPHQQTGSASTPNDARRQPGGAPSPAGEPVNSSSYKIGPADVLNIHVWNEQQFSGPVAVHEDGMFTLPLVGDLKAGGMTPVEVEGEVTKALAKYVRQPLVTITVQQVGSKQYYMDGQIAKAGEYPLVVPTTVLEAISKAGGLQPFANGKRIYILRGTTRIKFNYKDVLRGKHMDQNILLKSGDHVVVP